MNRGSIAKGKWTRSFIHPPVHPFIHSVYSILDGEGDNEAVDVDFIDFQPREDEDARPEEGNNAGQNQEQNEAASAEQNRRDNQMTFDPSLPGSHSVWYYHKAKKKCWVSSNGGNKLRVGWSVGQDFFFFNIALQM